MQQTHLERPDVLADDTARALVAASARLRHEFVGQADPELIELLLAERYAALARGARITQYLPLLAERSVRQDLRSGGAAHGVR